MLVCSTQRCCSKLTNNLPGLARMFLVAIVALISASAFAQSLVSITVTQIFDPSLPTTLGVAALRQFIATGNYSDGSQQEIGQIALASISNPDSLVAVGQSNYEIGPDTSTPVIGMPNTGSRGNIEGGALEDSTVDIATEFTNLIVYQRSYEANSKVISTMNQITQDLLAIQQ